MEWVRGATIGQGSFGTVSLAISRSKSSDTPQLLCVKSCGISHSASLMNEKRILEEFKDCPDIIRCYGDSFTYENGQNLYNVLLEYASQGTLFDTIKNSADNRLQEDEVRRLIRGIIRGLNYIHKLGYVHCDIKLQNILLNQDGDVKIADFGLSKTISEKKDGNSVCELRGTLMYMSPEMVVGGDQRSAADIWALGCLIAEMLTGAPVWNCSDVPTLLMKIGGEVDAVELLNIPAKVSDEGKDFMSKCFIKDPKKRWTAEMLLNHPFLASDDRSTTELRDGCEQEQPSFSPRSPFDFPDWVSVQSSVTLPVSLLSSPEHILTSSSWFPGELKSPTERLRRLVSNEQQCNWSFSVGWFTVR